MNTQRQSVEKVAQYIIHRLDVASLRALTVRQEECYHAGMQLGTSSQLEAHNNMNETIQDAINRITERDITLIFNTIKQETQP